MEKNEKKIVNKQMKMLHLLYLMDIGTIDTKDLSIEDEFGHKWMYGKDYADFMRMGEPGILYPQYIFFQEYYNGEKCMDYLDIKVTRLPDKLTIEDTKEVENPETKLAHKKAQNNICKIIEKLYMDLDMEIDNCQGCMDELDVAFEEINIYKEILKTIFNIDTEQEHSRIYKEWCDNYDKKKLEEENQLKPIFEQFKFNALDLMELDDTNKLANLMLEFLMQYNINIDTLNTQEKLLQEKLENM